MRALPNMKVFAPCDALEAKKATLAAAQIWGPVYLRFQREKTPIITTLETPYIPGKAEIFWLPGAAGAATAHAKKADVLIIACGGLLYNALRAARDLEKEKIGAVVLNVHTIKPLDTKHIVELVKKIGAVVTVEEHQVNGGLGGAVAEAVAKYAPAPIEFIGMQDTFGESGAPAELIKKYGMEAKDIVAAAKRAIKRNK
jgi:transketolase